MSDYYHALDQPSKARYLEKLTILGLDEKYNPCATYNNGSFKDNMALWAPVEFGHIWCYFIERPGLYTKHELLQWKSLEAYNYFKSEHVRTVEIWNLRSEHNLVILRAYVNPSQSSTRSPNHA